MQAIQPLEGVKRLFVQLIQYQYGTTLSVDELPDPLPQNSPQDYIRELATFCRLKVNEYSELGDTLMLDTPCLLVGIDGFAMAIDNSDEGIRIRLEDGDEKLLKKEALKEQFFVAVLISQKPSESYRQWITRHLGGVREEIGSALLVSVFINILILAVPLFTIHVYDRVIPNNALETLMALASGVLIALGFDFWLKQVRTQAIEQMGQQIGLAMESELMERLLQAKGIRNQYSEGMQFNLFKELKTFREILLSKTLVPLLDLPFLFLMLFVLYLIAPPIALMVFFLALLLGGVTFMLSLPKARAVEQIHQAMPSQQAFLLETLRGSSDLKNMGAAQKRLRKWKEGSIRMQRQEKTSTRYTHLSTQVAQLFAQGITVPVVGLGAVLIASQEMSVGSLIAATILGGRCMAPVVSVIGMLPRWKEFKQANKTLQEFWESTQKQQSATFGTVLDEATLECQNISYFYKGTQEATLKSINIKLAPGEKVAILGPTGSGKSTLFSILAGNDTPSGGRVFLGGHALEGIRPEELPSMIGVVNQEPVLFNGTISDNLSMGKGVSRGTMLRMMQAVGAEELISRHPQGLDRHVGEFGRQLSPGQRRLIALARALVLDPPVVIMDEPTSGMDISLERRVIGSLKETLEGRTALIITHRMPVCELVDRVIMLHEGQVVLDGARDEVLQKLGMMGKTHG